MKKVIAIFAVIAGILTLGYFVRRKQRNARQKAREEHREKDRADWQSRREQEKK